MTIDIGNRIRKRRTELNLSIEALAKKIKKNRATIYRYESGDIEELPTSVLKPLAEALETTPEYLMGWNNESDNNTNVTINNKNTVIVLGRDNSGRTEYTITDQQRKAIQAILETYKDIPDDDNF